MVSATGSVGMSGASRVYRLKGASKAVAANVKTTLRLKLSKKSLKAVKRALKKHKRLKWSGRGLMPIWMREEMKGTKLTKDDFLIK